MSLGLLQLNKFLELTSVSQAHKLLDRIHDIDLRALDTKTVGEVPFTNISTGSQCFRDQNSILDTRYEYRISNRILSLTVFTVKATAIYVYMLNNCLEWDM